MAVVREVAAAANGVRALAMILRYILQHSDVDPAKLQSFLINQADERLQEAIMTGADELIVVIPVT